MTQRCRVELLAALSPLRQVPVHQRDEATVVVAFHEVYQLVDDDVFEALYSSWFFTNTRILSTLSSTGSDESVP